MRWPTRLLLRAGPGSLSLMWCWANLTQYEAVYTSYQLFLVFSYHLLSVYGSLWWCFVCWEVQARVSLLLLLLSSNEWQDTSCSVSVNYGICPLIYIVLLHLPYSQSDRLSLAKPDSLWFSTDNSIRYSGLNISKHMMLADPIFRQTAWRCGKTGFSKLGHTSDKLTAVTITDEVTSPWDEWFIRWIVLCSSNQQKYFGIITKQSWDD